MVLLLASTFAGVSLGGCYAQAEIGTLDDEEAEAEVDEPDAEAPAAANEPCTYDACYWFCYEAALCSYDAGTAHSVCINECLDTCGDGYGDEEDAEVMACVDENEADYLCTDGLLESCCERTGGFSDLCP
jgi:hypothetical protein